jgi:hypothetical protein
MLWMERMWRSTTLYSRPTPHPMVELFTLWMERMWRSTTLYSRPMMRVPMGGLFVLGRKGPTLLVLIWRFTPHSSLAMVTMEFTVGACTFLADF